MANWIWYTLAAYLAICWIGTIWVFKCDDVQSNRQSLTRFRFSYRLFSLVASFIAAPLLPLFFVHCYLQFRREALAWKKFSRVHRPYLFEQKHLANMPPELQEYISRLTPEINKAGFSELGDFLLKSEPLVIEGRCLISSFGESVATVINIDGNLTFSITSVLENGRFIETSSFEFSISLLKKVNSTERLTVVSVVGASFDQAYQEHLVQLAKLENLDRCRTLAFEKDCFQLVMHYANTAFGEIKFQWGELDSPPEPAAVIPSGKPISMRRALKTMPASPVVSGLSEIGAESVAK